MRLNDEQIRPWLRDWIRARDEPDQVFDELPLRGGRARVDLAAVGADLHAYEIKGQDDRLTRLKNQTKYFSEVCHRCTVVTTPNYISKVDEHVPEWWEIVLADNLGSGVSFGVWRPGSANPERVHRATMMMLWKDEILDLMEHYGYIVDPKINKSLLLLKLRDVLPEVDMVWREVREALLVRCQDEVWKEAHVK